MIKLKSAIQPRRFIYFLFLLTIHASIVFAQNSLDVAVDATDAPKSILHVREKIQVKPGNLTLFYPKWIPGEHSPTGPLNNVVNLFIKANGKPLTWRRDDVEMFAFHLTIPANVKEIEITFDDAADPGTTSSANLARIKWNRLLLYPINAKSDDVKVSSSLKLPADWKYATALTTAKESKNSVDFNPTTLTTFVDSPAVVGKFFRRVLLSDEFGANHEIDLFADSAEALEYNPQTLAGWKNLIKEARLMFGARHYNSYKFLVTLSDQGGSEGLEHHESSEDGVGEKGLSGEFELLDLNGLLGHEYAHSWNGKYRRPIGLATGDFQTPMRAELLWIYEGLTEYLGDVLPARSGLWTAEHFRDVIAEVSANMDNQTGRRWRPLADTATAVQFTYGGERAWRNQRRNAEYYYEGELIWLEADVLIRQKSMGKLSLDDFLRKFHGGQNSGAMVKTYNFNEIVKTLNDVLPYDWRTFFTERVYQVQNRAPLGGITNGGWKLIYNDQPNSQIKVLETVTGNAYFSYSIGIIVNASGTIRDINPDLAAAKSGLAPQMTIKKINGEDFSVETLRKAVAATTNQASMIELEAENGSETKTYKINYRGGEKYPHLVRDSTKADLFSSIAKPLLATNGLAFGVVSKSAHDCRPCTIRNLPHLQNVTGLHLNQAEIFANCATDSNACADKNRLIEVSTVAIDSGDVPVTYVYTVSGGKIIGTGANVVWDLSGVSSGTYVITAGIDYGCGVCGQTQTKTVKVVECPDCD